jgi:hypothetical protein
MSLVFFIKHKTTLNFGGGFVPPVALAKGGQRLAALLFGSNLFLLCNFLFLSHWASLPESSTNFGQAFLIFYPCILKLFTSSGVASLCLFRRYVADSYADRTPISVLLVKNFLLIFFGYFSFRFKNYF